MPNIVEITDFHAPELDPYARLTQNQLRNRLEPEKGIFIAESPKVIARALDAGYKPVSLLMERKQITGPAAGILSRCGDAPVYTADREMLAELTGFELTRGVLCAFRRPAPRPRGRALQQRPPGGRAGGHRGLHQCGRHLPLGGGAEHGRCPRSTPPAATRSAAAPSASAWARCSRCPGRSWARRPADWPEKGMAQPPLPRLQDRRDGPQRPLGEHRRRAACRRAEACHRAGHRGRRPRRRHHRFLRLHGQDPHVPRRRIR